MANEPTPPSTQPLPRELPSPSRNGQPAAPLPGAEVAVPIARPGSILATLRGLWKHPTHGYVHQVDGTREVVETVVFVVVLVLLLKSFAAEAFVIPTGSMATTLWGYQKWVECPECGYGFPVNASQEVDPQSGRKPEPIVGCTCPNCRFHIDITQLPPMYNEPHSGDRVLVAKSLYETGLMQPTPMDVVVFKFPRGPEKDNVQVNYIKRLIGLGGQTIGIHYGNLYAAEATPPYPEDQQEKALDRWKDHFMHKNDLRDALENRHLAEDGKPRFKILRKVPDKILAMRRVVYDNDHPVRGHADVVPPRWRPAGGGWQAGDARDFRSTATDAVAWLRYRHVLFWEGYYRLLLRHLPEVGEWVKSEWYEAERFRAEREGRRWEKVDRDFIADELAYHLARLYQRLPDFLKRREERLLADKPDLFRDADAFRPQLITDFLGYNTWEVPSGQHMMPPPNWVGDLMLDCEVVVDQPEGELVLELSEGVDRFRANFDLATGVCTLYRVRGDAVEKMDSKPTALKQKGTYQVRFANVDDRLTLWVDGSLPFGDGVVYDEAREHGPTANDLEPVSIGVKGAAVAVRKLKVYRDTYYTVRGAEADSSVEDWSDPDRWEALRKLPGTTLYVQPGHYLCLGDNSPESSDGREWGLVPERLLLGRAMVVYYPFYFPLWPLNSPVNRLRLIE